MGPVLMVAVFLGCLATGLYEGYYLAVGVIVVVMILAIATSYFSDNPSL